MKKVITLVVALLSLCTLSAQPYKVGDIYDKGGKKGIVFEVSNDGNQGKIIAITQPSEKMTWHRAMEWGKELKDGWYIPSYDEFEVLLDRLDVVGNKLQEVGVKAPHFCWSTTEFGADCAWCVSMRTDSKGGFYKGNKFNICIVSKF
jgi:hypothetical protein